MGCWNGSCMISGLSISPGDKTVAFPMVLINGEWVPVALPFVGKYNDYGSIENIEENIYTKNFTNWFLKNYGFSKNYDEMLKDKKVSEIPPEKSIWIKHQFEYSTDDKKIETISDILNILEREGCRKDVCEIRGYCGGYNSFSLCLAHYDVYKKVIEMFDEDGGGSDWLNESIQSLLNFDIKELIDMNDAEKMRSVWKLVDSYNVISSPTEHYRSYGVTISDYLACSKEEYLNFINLSVEHFKFRYMVEVLRKPFSLPQNAGSQHDNHKDMKKLNSFLNKFITQIKKEHNDRYK